MVVAQHMQMQHIILTWDRLQQRTTDLCMVFACVFGCGCVFSGALLQLRSNVSECTGIDITVARM